MAETYTLTTSNINYREYPTTGASSITIQTSNNLIYVTNGYVTQSPQQVLLSNINISE